MKKLISFFVSIAMSSIMFGQGVGIGTATPNASAALEITSTTQGVLVPRLSTTQRIAIASPATGLLVFDLNTNSFWFRSSTSWMELVDTTHNLIHAVDNNLYLGMGGNVGIGTSTPEGKLTIKTAPQSSGLIHTDGTIKVGTAVNATSGYLGTFSSHPLQLGASNFANQLVLAINGRVGVGTSNPTQLFHVEGNTYIKDTLKIGTTVAAAPISLAPTTGAKISLSSSGANQYGIGMAANVMQMYTPAASTAIGFGTGNSTSFVENMRVTSDGRLGVGTAAPSATTDVIRGTATDGTARLRGTSFDSYFSKSVAENTYIRGGKTNSDVLINDAVGLGKVGIGTSTPVQKLSVDGKMYVRDSIGIGVANPGFPIALPSVVGEKISLYGNAGPNFGFGIAPLLMTMHVDGPGAAIAFGFGTGAGFTEGIRMTGDGKLGIGTASPTAPLQFANTIANRKMVLYDQTGNDNEYYGLGINPATLRYQVPTTTSDHVFYAGSDPLTSVELIRIKGTGKVGIGTQPSSKLDIEDGAGRTGIHPAERPMYVTGNIGAASNGIEFRHENASQGIGFGFNTIYAAGNNPDQDLGMSARGTAGNVLLSTNGNERMRVTGDGKIGIGVASPSATMEIARGSAPSGSLMVNGTTYSSHFNFGTPEDTYIRGGKDGANVILNDVGTGKVGIGIPNPDLPFSVKNKFGVDASGAIHTKNTSPRMMYMFEGSSTANKMVVSHSPAHPTWGLQYDANTNQFNFLADSTKVMVVDLDDHEVAINGDLDLGYDVVNNAAAISPFTTVTVYCNCPPGSIALGGGFEGTFLDVIRSLPSPNGVGWEVTANNFDIASVSHTLTVYTTCARIK